MSNETENRAGTAVLVQPQPPESWTAYARRRAVVHPFEVAVSLFVVGLVGWLIVDSLLTLLTLPGWVPPVTAAAAAVTVFLWLRNRAWTRRARLLVVVLVVLAVATPLASHYA